MAEVEAVLVVLVTLEQEQRVQLIQVEAVVVLETELWPTLYRALGHAHDFALAAAEDREGYA